MSKRTQLSASLEDYIEAIYNIVEEKQKARSKDISACLNSQVLNLSSDLMGPSGFEPLTPVLSGLCSNQLSYGPDSRLCNVYM